MHTGAQRMYKNLHQIGDIEEMLAAAERGRGKKKKRLCLCILNIGYHIHIGYGKYS